MSHQDRHHHHGKSHHHHHASEHDHHHDHHHHDHHHGNEHSHPHGHGEPVDRHDDPRFSDKAKLLKILEHWLHHNEDHAKSYAQWADRARALGEEAVAGILDEVASETIRQNDRFREAVALVRRIEPPR